MRLQWIEIQLRSDLCPANGDAIAGLIDVEIAQAYGLPLLPAKRLKGCLRGIGWALADGGVVSPETVEALFGTATRSGMLRVWDAHLYRAPLEDEQDAFCIEEYEPFAEALAMKFSGEAREVENGFHAKEILELFTSVRTQTAIEADGVAADRSLRSLRVINRGVVLRAKVALLVEDDEASALLQMCVKGLRHIGLGITRGFGEVACVLHPYTELTRLSEGAAADDLPLEGEVEVRYALKTRAPLLMPGAGGLYDTCAECIDGGHLLGALAGLYVARHGLQEDAHANDAFADIFLRGSVKFGYAFPAVGDLVFHPCPASVQVVKNKTRVCDLAVDEAAKEKAKEEAESDQKTEKEALRPIKDMVVFSGERLYRHVVEKEVRMHHARPKDGGVGHAVGPDFGADLGQFFQYTAICAGQRFVGTLRGPAQRVRMLLKLLEERGNRLWLGRSRTAEYGEVEFAYCGQALPAEQESGLDHFTLYLETPMVLREAASGRVTQDPQALIALLQKSLGCEVRLEKRFLKFTTLAGYNRKWRLPKPQISALAAGTALVLKTARPVIPAELEGRAWGEETGAGCGRVRILACGAAGACWTLCSYEERELSNCEPMKETNLLLETLQKQVAKKRKQRESRTLALKAKIGQLHSTAIEQLLSFGEETEFSYQAVLHKIANVKNERKRGKMKGFLKPCEQQDAVFMKEYIELAKFQTREGNVE